jgi:hypothetical protein
VVYGRFQHEGIVDGDHAHPRSAIPARFTAASNARVHDIVTNQEEGLQQFGQPSERARQSQLLGRQRPLEQMEGRVGHRKTSVELSARSIGVD